jgi:hypothetical protein
MDTALPTRRKGPAGHEGPPKPIGINVPDWRFDTSTCGTEDPNECDGMRTRCCKADLPDVRGRRANRRDSHRDALLQHAALLRLTVKQPFAVEFGIDQRLPFSATLCLMGTLKESDLFWSTDPCTCPPARALNRLLPLKSRLGLYARTPSIYTRCIRRSRHPRCRDPQAAER